MYSTYVSSLNQSYRIAALASWFKDRTINFGSWIHVSVVQYNFYSSLFNSHLRQL